MQLLLSRNKMKRIRQKHVSGCGVACAAMLTGISYNKSLKLMRPDRKPGECACTSLNDVLRTIEELEFSCKVSYKKGKLSSLDRDTMIIVKNSGNSHTTNHVVMWDHQKQEIFDPWGRPSGYTVDEKYIKKHEVYRISLT